MIFITIAYLDRYSKTKIFQLQGAGDEFFLVDSEVRLHLSINRTFLLHTPNRITFGMICK